MCGQKQAQAYRLITTSTFHIVNGIMVLGNVQVQKSFRGKVLVTLGAPVGMKLCVMYIVIFVGCE